MRATPEQRHLQAKAAAHTLHAQVADPAAHTAPARRAFQQRFYDGLDHLPPQERERRAAHRRTAYYTNLALRSSQARMARKDQTQ